jgi:hypothetical protein
VAVRLQRPPLGRDYDLLFVSCQNPADLYHLGPLGPWRDRCRKLVVYVDELWAHTIPARPGEMAMLAQFDHIVCGQEHSVGPLARATGVPAAYVAYGVDALRFAPVPVAPPRTIDVFNMGRRSPVMHAAFRRLAATRGWFYVHDTVDGRAVVHDPREHRLQLAGFIQRARYFVTNGPKVTAPEETGGQQEVGFRFYEGAMAGAVLVGEPPRCPSFDEHFGWEDAVIHMPYGTDEPEAILDALDGDPARVAAIRRRNVAESLRRHDWGRRWARILELVGLRPTEALGDRQARLDALAAAVERGGEQGLERREGEAGDVRPRRAA